MTMLPQHNVLWALTKPEGRAAAFILVTIAIFFTSLVMSCQELRYMVSGKSLDVAGALELRTNKEKDGTITHTKTLTYRWVDGLEQRQNSMDVPLNYELPPSNQVKIQYIPGRDASRLQGQTNKVWVYVFFGSIIAAVVGGWILVKVT